MRFVHRYLCLLLIGLAACNEPAPAPHPATTTPTETAQAAAPEAIATAQAFVDALNRADYATAFQWLDTQSQAKLGNAEALRNEYLQAKISARAINTQTRLGGLLQNAAGSASVSLITTWQCEWLGKFDAESTLSLHLQAQSLTRWRIAWTRDAIVQGLVQGKLAMVRSAPQPRGSIFFADGSLAAGPSEITTIGVQRGALATAEAAATGEEQRMLAALSQITGQVSETLRAQYADKPADWFVPLANLTDEQMEAATAALQPFKAIIARRSYTRVYMQTRIAPHVVGWVGPQTAELQTRFKAQGYTGDESVGVTGVEAVMEEKLAGAPQIELRLLRETDGSQIKTIAKREFVRAQDLTLTIEPRLQVQVQNLLGNRNGAAIVLNTRTGDVLAMVSYPTFDASVFSSSANSAARTRLLNDPRKPLLNRAAQAIYPPGSVFKMATMAAGMEEGLFVPADIFLDRGIWDGLGSEYRKTCWLKRGHGRINLQDGLSASCDIVFYELGKALDDKGQTLLPDYARRFGFGARTGIELSGEAAGVVPGPQWKRQNVGATWTTGDAVNMSIGQGYVLASPLQVAQMTAAIANDGVVLRPRLVQKVGADAAPLPVVSQSKLPASANTLQAIRAGMDGVVSHPGFGTAQRRFASFDWYFSGDAFIAGNRLTRAQRAAARKLSVAGKSGTAQAPGATEKPFAWFTAYAPADQPAIAVTVLLENAGEGSVQAAPLVRQILEAYFGLPISAAPREVASGEND